MNVSRYRKLLYMLDLVRSVASSRNQHVVGSRGGVLAYVRVNIDYDQTVSKGGFQEAVSPLWPWSLFQLRQQPYLGIVFSIMFCTWVCVCFF